MTVTTSRARARSFDESLGTRNRRRRSLTVGAESMNMDGDDARPSNEHFELVPYSNEWTVIL